MIKHITLDMLCKGPIDIISTGSQNVFVFIGECEGYCLTTTEPEILFQKLRFNEQLRISKLGISFLLQNGVVPPPYTVFENIFMVSSGDKACLESVHGRVKITFSHTYPYQYQSSAGIAYSKQSSQQLLSLLADSLNSQINQDVDSFLFHSAGKDSNTLALAAAEGAMQKRITFVSHKSSTGYDESTLSAVIAKKLGFQHIVLDEKLILSDSNKEVLIKYISSNLFPCLDNVSLAYPFYAEQVPDLRGANIINGDGNDLYMKSMPTSKEKIGIKYLSRNPFKKLINKNFSTTHWLYPLSRSACEWSGVNGFSHKDAKSIYNPAIELTKFWSRLDKSKRGMSVIDLKSDAYATISIAGLHIRKVQNFADAYNCNLILPFADPLVVKFFQNLSVSELYDPRRQRNKVFLRKLLSDRLDLDSDVLGKFGYNNNTASQILYNWPWIYSEITKCKFWNKSSLEKTVLKLKQDLNGNPKSRLIGARYLYRLFILSLWLNYSKCLKPTNA